MAGPYVAPQPVTDAVVETNTGTIATNTSNIPAKGAAVTANSTPVNIASDQVVPVTSVPNFNTNSYTITATGPQTTVDIHTKPLKSWSISVKGTGASATSWSVNLEISLDGTNFTTFLTHVNTTEGDGTTLVSGTTLAPALYYRVNVTSLSLGSATNIVVTALGV